MAEIGIFLSHAFYWTMPKNRKIPLEIYHLSYIVTSDVTVLIIIPIPFLLSENGQLFFWCSFNYGMHKVFTSLSMSLDKISKQKMRKVCDTLTLRFQESVNFKKPRNDSNITCVKKSLTKTNTGSNNVGL